MDTDDVCLSEPFVVVFGESSDAIFCFLAGPHPGQICRCL